MSTTLAYQKIQDDAITADISIMGSAIEIVKQLQQGKWTYANVSQIIGISDDMLNLSERMQGKATL